MKKVLFATTALVASAGIAAADVKLSGWGEMGLVGGDSIETQFHGDIDVKFSLSGETDNGLTFGATIDLDEVKNGINADAGSQSIWIGGSWGKLTLGDTDGAMDWAMKEAAIGSSIDEAHEHAGYNGNAWGDGLYDKQVLRYDNSFGDIGIAVSAILDDKGTGTAFAPIGPFGDAVLGLGVKYSADLGGATLGFGLGYSSEGSGTINGTVYTASDIYGISVDVKTDGGIAAILNYSDFDGATHTGLAVGYTMDALTVGVNWGEYDDDVLGTMTGTGLTVNYDLGGGVKVLLGYGSDDIEDRWSLGLSMKF